MMWMKTRNKTDEDINGKVAWFKNNRDAVTVVSPTTHRLGATGLLEEQGKYKRCQRNG